jgi:GTP-binding protein HflX
MTNKEQMIVFNKKDQLQDVFKQKIILRSHPNSFLVSSFDKEDIKHLRSFILNHFLDKQNHYDLFVPYEEGNAHSIIISKSNIIKSYPHEKGIFYRIKIPSFIFKALGIEHFILSPTDPMRKEFSF